MQLTMPHVTSLAVHCKMAELDDELGRLNRAWRHRCVII
jgi:hypothetical protein